MQDLKELLKGQHMIFHGGLAGDEMVVQVCEKLRESVKTTCPLDAGMTERRLSSFVKPNGINRFSNQPNVVIL